MPIDPVCGIEMDESLALIHEHDGKKYYFCCNGCKRIFVKKPKKFGLFLNILIHLRLLLPENNMLISILIPDYPLQ